MPQWTIPGKYVENYEIKATSSALTKFDPKNLQKAKTGQFYWYDRDDSREVKLTAKIGSKSFENKAKFKVEKPSPTITMEYNNVARISERNGTVYLSLGRHVQNEDGICFSRDSMPSGMGGEVVFAQIIKKFKASRIKNSTYEVLVDVFNVLDGKFSDPQDSIYRDSPATSLEGFNITKVSVEEDSFKLMLLYRPTHKGSSSIWVPICEINWSWKADATTNNPYPWPLPPKPAPPPTWTIHQNAPNPSVPKPSSSETTEFPIWDSIWNSI